jgi:hypothetical protein
MTLDNWNPNDYIVDFPDINYSGEIVNAPVIWKIGQITKYIYVVLHDAINAIANGSELSGLVLGLSTLDYLAGYYAGKKTAAKDFKNYMKKYFPDKYIPFINSIYDQLRCGLLHNLVANNPWTENPFRFEINRSVNDHLIERADGIAIFSVRIFLEDLRRSFVIYSYELIMKPEENIELIANFEKRYNRLNGLGSVMIYKPE